MIIRLTLTLIICFLNLAIAWADTAGDPIPWEQLTPKEQRLLGPLQNQWGDISSERQNRLRKGAFRWDKLSPEQRGEMKNRFQQWNQISPDKRANLRQRFKQFQNLPQEKRHALRQKRQWFKSLPLERKQHIRKKWLGLSPEKRQSVRKRFGLDRPHAPPTPHSNRPSGSPPRNR